MGVEAAWVRADVGRRPWQQRSYPAISLGRPLTTEQVILLGADSPIGLAVIRELGQHGVAVHAIGREPRSIGLYSRFATTRHVREKSEDALIAQIDRIGKDHACRWLMTIGESDILMLLRRRGDFAFVKPIVPDPDAFATILDKGATFAVAEAVGIRTPRTISADSPASLAAAGARLGFPLVLKWANPHRVMAKLARLGRPLDKCRYVYSTDELLAYLKSMNEVGEYPLVQEYCPGVGLGQMIFMHKGQAIQRFQHLRVCEWPPEGGVSAVCESLPAEAHSETMAQSIELLKRLGWEGPAMVEYRHDPATGESRLMEVNGRFWGSLPLAFHAGAAFAWLTYQAGSGRTPQTPADYRVGLRCRYFVPELKRLVRILTAQDLIQDRALRFSRLREAVAFLGRYLDPRTRYYVFAMGDPRPFVEDIRSALASRLLRRH